MKCLTRLRKKGLRRALMFYAESRTNIRQITINCIISKLQGSSDIKALIKALGVMMCKHTVSVYDLINDFEQGKNISIDLWNEKIGNSINYLLLLNAMVIEHELDKQEEK